MAFQPVFNNIGPALIERGYARAGELTAQGTAAAGAAMAQGVSSAGQSIAGGISAAASQWKKDAAQTNSNAGVLEAYSKMNDQAVATTGNPIIPQEYLSSLANEKNRDKVSGGLMAIAPVFDSFLSTQRQLSVANATNGFRQETAAATRAATAASKPVFGVSVADGVNIYGGQGNGK